MRTEGKTVEELAALASFLAGRREAILATWGELVASDPSMVTASSLSFHHFQDLIPDVLENFEDRLRTAGLDSAGLESEEHERVVDHGLHRWKQGFSLHELTREWTHLQLSVQAELERYDLAHRELPPAVMPTARRIWTELCCQGIDASVAQYARLQQTEAAGRLQDLESALETLREMEHRRAESWHEAAHDLRGSVGLVTTTTSILAEDGVPEALRAMALRTLQSSVSSLHQLLEDLMSLARLEAGRERRCLEAFDAAALLDELGESLRPLAHERGLFLRAAGPATLAAEGDPAKVRRIVLNLALNALRYTDQGGVTLSWGETRERDVDRWFVRLEDTGPGLHLAPGPPVARELEYATDLAREVEQKAGDPHGVEPVPGSASSAPIPATGQQPGEGIGLSIVKRLCELLEASLEVVTEAGKGTTFQVVLPRRYGSSRE